MSYRAGAIAEPLSAYFDGVPIKMQAFPFAGRDDYAVAGSGTCGILGI